MSVKAGELLETMKIHFGMQKDGLADLNTEAGRLYGVDSIYELTKKDASRFVDELKEAA